MTQLFSNEYFGIGLIITIAFLTILFIIVLIMALRDVKKRNEKEENIEEKNNNEIKEDFAFKENSEEVKLEVPLTVSDAKKEEEHVMITPEEEVTEIKNEEEEKKELEEFKTADFKFENPQEEVEKEPTVKIDFDALANSLRNELEKEEPVNNNEFKPDDIFDKTKENKAINLDELKSFASELQKEEGKPLFEPTNEPLNIVNNKDNLYINNEESKVIKEEKVYGAPVKLKVPNIEMPKFASAPKDSVRVTNTEPVLNHKEEEPKYDTPNFENIENETFSLK